MRISYNQLEQAVRVAVAETGRDLEVSRRNGYVGLDVNGGSKTLFIGSTREVYTFVRGMIAGAQSAQSELCPECGQPDNCGDCNHTPV